MTEKWLRCVDISLPIDQCWPWQGRLDRGGYGRAGRSGAAHRVVYMALVGPIPEGLVIDHLCKNRACCNPAHLEPVTALENAIRGLASPTKTHCINGHEFTPENTYRRKTRRHCRACNRAAVARRKARKMASAKPAPECKYLLDPVKFHGRKCTRLTVDPSGLCYFHVKHAPASQESA